MTEAYTVELDLRLVRRVQRWTKRSQIELSALLDILREHGPEGLKINSSWTQISASRTLATASQSFVFEFKIGGAWMPFRLDVCADDFLVLRGG